MVQKVAILLILNVFYYTAHAQLDTAKLNKYFRQLDINNKAMCSVCIYDKGIITYDKAIGFADVSKSKKSNVYTQYRIGSISKMFTAVMILQLIEEKKLSLAVKLSQYYPGIHNSEEITIEQLLNHRSGIENITATEDFADYMETAQSEADLIKKIEGLASEFEPDSKYSYSNTNYILLSFIIEKVTKSSYGEQLLQRICAKAALADTKVGAKINTANNEAQSYHFENKLWTPSTETDMSVPGGAGNIVSTSKDLCLFITALFEGKLISKPMLEKMKTLKDGYGYGMIQFPFGQKKFYGHTGAIDDFHSMLAYNEADQTAVCILGNGFDYPINDIAIALLSVQYKEPFTIPTFEKRKLTAAEARSIEGVYGNDKVNMKITVFRQGENLMAQATGQEAFPLTKVSELEYKFELAGIKINFIKENEGQINDLKLTQGGMDIVFVKE